MRQGSEPLDCPLAPRCQRAILHFGSVASTLCSPFPGRRVEAEQLRRELFHSLEVDWPLVGTLQRYHAAVRPAHFDALLLRVENIEQQLRRVLLAAPRQCDEFSGDGFGVRFG